MGVKSSSVRAARRLFLTFCCILVMLLGACAREPLQRQEAYVFGTRVEVLIWGKPEAHAREATAAVLREFDRLHRMLHAWQPSELTALNAAIARGERDIPVSPELGALLRDAQAIAARSDGLFDPAIGALVALWGFHSDEFKPQLPDPAAVEALVKERPRMSDLTVTDNRVTSRNSAVQLDLGGHAKGYALDRAVAILRGQSIANALVNIGGNVLALGDKDGQPWRIGIQHPRATAPLAALDLKDGEAVGTSGDYQRYFELGGQRYSHLLDPRSGRPAQGTQAVTVLIPPGSYWGTGTGILSDAVSKPLFVAGAGAWRAMAARLGVEQALRVDGRGTVEVTAALRQRLSINAPDMKIVTLP